MISGKTAAIAAMAAACMPEAFAFVSGPAGLAPGLRAAQHVAASPMAPSKAAVAMPLR